MSMNTFMPRWCAAATSALEIVAGAVFRIDRIVVAHGVRTAERALGLELAHRMNGHQPEHGDAEIFQAVELRDDALEVSFLREGAREHFVDHRIAQPVGTLARAGRLLAASAARASERRQCGQRQQDQRRTQQAHAPDRGSNASGLPSFPNYVCG